MPDAVPETEDALYAQHEDLARLLASLRRARGFALLFAVCNAPSYRNRLVQALADRLEHPIVRVHLVPIEINPDMDEQIAAACEGQPAEVPAFVFGLENLLPTADTESRYNTLRQLNWHRAKFGRLGRPIVFWVPDYVQTLIANEAPDFHDWYSGVYLFPVPNEALPDVMANTLTKSGDFAAVSGLSFEEKKRWREVLEELVAEPRGDTPAEQENLVSLLRRLANLAEEMAAYATAKAYLERAIEIDEALYGSNHPNVAAGVGNLGIILHTIGDLEGAKAAYERALHIHEATLGPNHPNVASSFGNIGSVQRVMGDLESAIAAHERALRIDEAAYGPDHPIVARDISNLGLDLCEVGDLDGAKAAYERALHIHEAMYGLDHPTVATDVHNLGNVLFHMGDLESAKAAYEQALRIDEAAYGAEYPKVAADVCNLGSVLAAMGDLEGAKAAFERAATIYQHSLGENHPDTQSLKRNLERIQAEIDEAKA